MSTKTKSEIKIEPRQRSLWEEIDLGDTINITEGSTVECFSSKKRGIVINIRKDMHPERGGVTLVVEEKTGNEMLPFLDECKLIIPYFSNNK